MQLTAQSNLPSTRMLIFMDVMLCAAFALVLIATAPWLADAMDLPTNLLRGAGLILIPWTAYLATAWKQARVSRGTVLTIVAVNAAWVLASLAILAAIEPNGLGVAFVLIQSAGVLLLAICQYLSSRTIS